MRANNVLPEAGDSGNLGVNDLTTTERLAYEAAIADARAECWRISAEVSERRGEASAADRDNQAYYEEKAANVWRRLAETKRKSDAERNKEPAQWCEIAAAKIKEAGDEAKRYYQELAEDGYGPDAPGGERDLKVLLKDADIDKLEHGLREVAAYLREAK